MKVNYHRSFAFSLVEVALALGLVTYCLVAVSGLLSIGISSDQISNQQTVVSNLVKAVISDLHATSVNTGTSSFLTSPQFGFQIPNAGQVNAVSSPQTVYFTEGANVTGVMGSSYSTDARYRVSVAFIPPASSNTRAGTSLRILATWPALADPNPSVWPSHYAGSFEIVTALDRN
jgi:uncharacterized protein (TIGR02598 family)